MFSLMEWRRKRCANKAQVLQHSHYPESIIEKSGYKFLLPGTKSDPILEDLTYTEETVCQAIKYKREDTLTFLYEFHDDLFGRNALLQAAETGDWDIFSKIRKLVGYVKDMHNDFLYSAVIGGCGRIVDSVLDTIGSTILINCSTIVKAVQLGNKKNFYCVRSNIHFLGNCNIVRSILNNTKYWYFVSNECFEFAGRHRNNLLNNILLEHFDETPNYNLFMTMIGAAEVGDLEYVKSMYNKPCILEIDPICRKRVIVDAYLIAIKFGHLDIVAFLEKYVGTENYAMTASIHSNMPNVIDYFIKQNGKYRFEFEHLKNAIGHGNTKSFDHLLSQGIMNDIIPYYRFEDVLEFFSTDRDTYYAKQMYIQGLRPVGWHIFFTECIGCGDLEFTEMVSEYPEVLALKHSDNEEERDKYTQCIEFGLVKAVMNGHLHSVIWANKLLPKENTRMSRCIKDAVEIGRYDIVKFLLENRTKKFGDDAVCTAVKLGYIDIFILLASHYPAKEVCHGLSAAVGSNGDLFMFRLANKLFPLMNKEIECVDNAIENRHWKLAKVLVTSNYCGSAKAILDAYLHSDRTVFDLMFERKHPCDTSLGKLMITKGDERNFESFTIENPWKIDWNLLASYAARSRKFDFLSILVRNVRIDITKKIEYLITLYQDKETAEETIETLRRITHKRTRTSLKNAFKKVLKKRKVIPIVVDTPDVSQGEEYTSEEEDEEAFSFAVDERDLTDDEVSQNENEVEGMDIHSDADDSEADVELEEDLGSEEF